MSPRKSTLTEPDSSAARGIARVNPRSAAKTPEKLTTMSAEPFNPKFEAAYGYKPNANVRKGYIAARLIAATVRSLPESLLEDRDELMRALNRYLQE